MSASTRAPVVFSPGFGAIASLRCAGRAAVSMLSPPGRRSASRLLIHVAERHVQQGASVGNPSRAPKQRQAGEAPHLIASGLVGDPTAPVIGIAGATNR